MVFAKPLRKRVQSGRITCSIRIWTRPHVKVGGRYRMEDGEIHVDSIEPIRREDITPALARESGFASVADLLKTAVHGGGRNVYLTRRITSGRGALGQRQELAVRSFRAGTSFPLYGRAAAPGRECPDRGAVPEVDVSAF